MFRSFLRLRVAAAGTLCTMLLLPSFSTASDEWQEFFNTQLPKNSQAPGRYIVMMKEDTNYTTESVLQNAGVTSDTVFEKIKGFASSLTEAQITMLRRDPRVAFIEPDYQVQAFAQTLPTGINRIDTELNPRADIDGDNETTDVDIAIIDTGVQKTHPDLNVYKQVNFTNEYTADDLNGHGTHVAGTAAARDNGSGVVGVAPGARIWSVKVLNRQGSGYMSDIIEGIDYVTQNADSIEVANMSLGCECISQSLNAALDRSIAAGVVYTVAAGNSNKDASTFSPANHPKVITVSAIADFNGQPGGGAKSTCYSDVDDTFANFSNYGPLVEIAAPGVCIYSTSRNSRYATLSGTSMASPHVAGAAALYLSTHPDASPDEVKNALVAQAWSQTDGNGFSGEPDGNKEPLLNATNL